MCMSASVDRLSPGRVLVHLPEPDPPRLIDKPPRRPAVGEELFPGWTACDYSMIRGEFAGELYEYEVWAVPSSSDSC